MKRTIESDNESITRSCKKFKSDPTALIEACKKHDRETALAIIRSGTCDPGYVDESGQTALMYACSKHYDTTHVNMTGVVEELLKTEKAKPNLPCHFGHTALLRAIGGSDVIVSNILINSGMVDPGYVTEDGTTALINACRIGGMSSVALNLIKTGRARPEHVNDVRFTALDYACYNGQRNPGVAMALIKSCGASSLPGHTCTMFDDTPLIRACMDDMPDVAMALINTGLSNPGHVTIQGYTALIFACKNLPRFEDVALALIRTGQANINAIDGEKFTALFYASVDGDSYDVTLELLKHGASVNQYIVDGGDLAWAQSADLWIQQYGGEVQKLHLESRKQYKDGEVSRIFQKAYNHCGDEA